MIGGSTPSTTRNNVIVRLALIINIIICNWRRRKGMVKGSIIVGIAGHFIIISVFTERSKAVGARFRDTFWWRLSR
jgi:hypothetical protein